MNLALALLTAALGQAPADDGQTLLFLGDDRPALVRVHVTIDGKTLAAAFEELIDALMAYADRNGDGVIDSKEREALPPPATLFSGALVGRRVGSTGRTPGAPGPLRRKGLKETYAPAGLVDVQQAAGSQGAGQGVTQALFKHLDTDGDGKLSRAELLAAEKLLDRLDLDDDELLTAREVGPNPYAPVNRNDGIIVAGPQAQAGRPLDPNAPFVVVTPQVDRQRLAFRLLEKYGPAHNPAKDRALKREHLGLSAAAFANLDVDGDGQLDANELGRYTEAPADLDVHVALGKPLEGVKPLTWSGPLADKARQNGEALELQIGNARLTLNLGGAGGMNVVTQVRPREFYLQQFKAADTDNNGYLDMKEAQASPLFAQAFKQMDRDGDGMLFEKEVIAYLDTMEGLQTKATACRAALTVTEGQGLFELLDTNRDGQLSRRELRAAVKVLGALTGSDDGKLAMNQVPRNFTVSVTRGQAGNLGPQVVAFTIGANMNTPAPPKPKGPAWFHKMDRNRDGDVSPREWLGTPEEFQRLDLDGDGLISLDEAIKAEELRQKASAGNR